ncbi:MAG: hypothetical protein QM500_13940 [Methylococcales bacterium]
MTITANLADGRVLNFPDGTDPAVIQATVKRMIAPQEQAASNNIDVPDGSHVSQDQLPQAQPGFGQQALGVLENVGSLASGAIAEPLAGLAGIAQAINPFAEEGAGASAVKATRDALTIKPKTEAGQAQQQAIGETLAPVGKALSTAESFLGDETLKLTGSPALAAIAYTLPSAALELIGIKGLRRASAIKAPTSKLIKKTLIESAPEVEQIKKASRSIFNELDNSGVAIKQAALKRLESNLDEIVKKQGIRERVTPEAFGAIQEVKKDIALGKPLSTSQMDELRTIAKNSIVATDPNKIRVGTAIVDEIDSFLDDIKSVDIEKGAQVSAAEVGKKYRTARKLWGRAKRSEMIQDAIEMGSSRKAGVEKGIRNELNNLLNRKKSRKFLTKEDVTAIRKVTDGDFKQNFASMVGGMGLKLENSPSIFGGLLSGGGVGAIASTIPGLGGAIAPIAVGAVTIGTISKEIAKKITKGRAQFLKTMSGAGNDAQEITKAYLMAVPKNKRKLSDLSDLLLDPNVDLSTLENIANETVKDAVKAAQFKRELLQASIALGAGINLEQGVENNESN